MTHLLAAALGAAAALTGMALVGWWLAELPDMDDDTADAGDYGAIPVEWTEAPAYSYTYRPH